MSANPIAYPGGMVAVRDAVYAYLNTNVAAGKVPLLGTVFRGAPKRQTGKDALAYPDLGQKSGAVSFIHVGRQTRRRVALGGAHGGQKLTDFEVSLPLFFRSLHRDAQYASSDMDALIDNVVALLEADRTLGAPQLIHEAGEGDAGIVVVQDLPTLGGQGTYHCWGSVDFTVRLIANT